MKPCVRENAKKFEGALFQPAEKNKKKTVKGHQTALGEAKCQCVMRAVVWEYPSCNRICMLDAGTT